MKLSVSNISWDNRNLPEYLRLLNQIGCSGVELAPSCIWKEPIKASMVQRRQVHRLIERNKLNLVGFHALLFNRPDLSLFMSRDSLKRTIDYLAELARLCSDLHGGVLVFGSPRNRTLQGRLYQECADWAQEGFYTLAEICRPLGITFCIEPLAPTESDFIKSAREGGEMVRKLAHPNFLLHLDAKSLITSGESIDEVLTEYGQFLTHFHVGDPGLTPPGSSGYDHTSFGRALNRIKYSGYVSIEMRRTTDQNDKLQITSSVEYVKRAYIDIH